jgi:glycosidase
MEFHINRSIRRQLGLADVLFSFNGNVIFANVAASRQLAQGLNELRTRQRGQLPIDAVVNAGALFAMGLIDELSHAMVALYRKQIDPAVHAEATRWFTQRLGRRRFQQLLLTFTEEFPGSTVYRGELTAEQWLAQSTDGIPNREAAFEELLLLWLANQNPAFRNFRELFDESHLRTHTAYPTLAAGLDQFFATRPPLAPEVGTLLAALRAPMLAAPDSLVAQLEFIRERWAPFLGEQLQRALLAIDIVREEDVAIWMRFHPPTAGPQHSEGKWQPHGFRGDEYIGFDEAFMIGPDGVRRPRYAVDHQAPLVEYEAFSPDQAWMPTVVMMAKNTYVWLEQLSRKYNRHIHRLDQIPDEELQTLADRGMTALWLIGLWERSVASRTIKRLRGSKDAVASAYSLKDYNIANDLGGNAAYEVLRDRAARFGLRLASDMVPNHMGLDSPWVIEHPDWFVHRFEPPFPVYRFNGPDLSTDPRAEIKIEDHYFDHSDAAVVFRLRTYADGATRYIYHGNDGTSFAWNDTAQLDYSKAVVREQVMQVILHVARLFPIIRFDAAMVLAKRHVQRLWFPLPGVGGSIPSRAENAISQEEFDALMPHEFWREVVDRVAVEVPGTLLLAEAFWLLEGYFVRTLGMHRVYNSAFMNMLRDEENAKYRSYLKKTIEFDPDIMKRYVNFMSNPDERTAIDQFGDGDKYFGVSTLLATLPGLPMFGHGQIEGFTERYGMDFKAPMHDEQPKQWLIDRYMREITPLLKKRYVFAESDHFVLYDFWCEFGGVDENVIAYSNRAGDERALVLYNNAFPSTRGTLHISCASFDKVSGQLQQRSLCEALALPTDDRALVRYRDHRTGLEYLQRAAYLRDHGITVSLGGFQAIVLTDWRVHYDVPHYPWDMLCHELRGQGVPSLDEALTAIRLRPVHTALLQALSEDNVNAFLATDSLTSPAADTTTASKPPAVDLAKPAAFVPEAPADTQAHDPYRDDSIVTEMVPPEPTAADLASPAPTPEAMSTAETVERHAGATRVLAASIADLYRSIAATELIPSLPPPDDLIARLVATPRTLLALAQCIVASLPTTLPSTEAFDRLLLRSAFANAFESLGHHGEEAWRLSARLRIALAFPSLLPALHTAAFWDDSDVRWLLGVHTVDGHTYFHKESFESLVEALDPAHDEALTSLALQAGYSVEPLIEPTPVL